MNFHTHDRILGSLTSPEMLQLQQLQHLGGDHRRPSERVGDEGDGQVVAPSERLQSADVQGPDVLHGRREPFRAHTERSRGDVGGEGFSGWDRRCGFVCEKFHAE